MTSGMADLPSMTDSDDESSHGLQDSTSSVMDPMDGGTHGDPVGLGLVDGLRYPARKTTGRRTIRRRTGNNSSHQNSQTSSLAHASVCNDDDIDYTRGEDDEGGYVSGSSDDAGSHGSDGDQHIHQSVLLPAVATSISAGQGHGGDPLADSLCLRSTNYGLHTEKLMQHMTHQHEALTATVL
jgi:hypothetical protein